MWAETGLGRISIEVKATEQSRSWFYRMSQMHSEVYVFVHLNNVECYILTRDEVAAAIVSLPTPLDGIYKLPANLFPAGSREGWDKLKVGKAPSMAYFNHMQPNTG